MKSAEEWIVKQCLSSPRVGSLEHKIMCDAIRDIQLDALKEAAGIAQRIVDESKDYPHYHGAMLVHDALLERSKQIEKKEEGE